MGYVDKLILAQRNLAIFHPSLYVPWLLNGSSMKWITDTLLLSSWMCILVAPCRLWRFLMWERPSTRACVSTSIADEARHDFTKPLVITPLKSWHTLAIDPSFSPSIQNRSTMNFNTFLGNKIHFIVGFLVRHSYSLPLNPTSWNFPVEQRLHPQPTWDPIFKIERWMCFLLSKATTILQPLILYSVNFPLLRNVGEPTTPFS